MINGAALMYRGAGALSVVLFAGNGTAPSTLPSFGNVYTLSAAKLTDDDYGQIRPYYVTYFFPTHDQETAFKLGGGRKLLQYLTAFIAGTGTLTLTFLCDTLANAWPLTVTRALSTAPRFDLECGGGSAQAQRIAVKFVSCPASGTDNGFNLQKMLAVLKPAARLPVRGAV